MLPFSSRMVNLGKIGTIWQKNIIIIFAIGKIKAYDVNLDGNILIEIGNGIILVARKAVLVMVHQMSI